MPTTTTAPDERATALTATPSAPVHTRRRVVGVAGVLAATVLLGWFGWANRASIDPSAWIDRIDLRWAAGSLGFALLSLLGASWNLIGASPVRLRLSTTMAAQTTGTAARLVSPASLGGPAVNVVLLRHAGAATGPALVAVSLSQAVQVLSTLAFVPLVATTLGVGMHSWGIPSEAVLVSVAAVVVVGVVVVSVLIPKRPAIRARIVRTVREVGGALAELARRPARLATCVAGALLMTVAMVGSLWAAAHAFGADLGVRQALVIVLIGSTAAGLVPLPGGVGASEAALGGALVAAGVALPLAIPTVAVFRLATLWLQVPVGVAAGAVLRRRGSL